MSSLGEGALGPDFPLAQGYFRKGPQAREMIAEFKAHLSSGLCRGSHRFDVCLQGTRLPGGFCRLDCYPAAQVPVKQAVSVPPFGTTVPVRG